MDYKKAGPLYVVSRHLKDGATGKKASRVWVQMRADFTGKTNRFCLVMLLPYTENIDNRK